MSLLTRTATALLVAGITAMTGCAKPPPPAYTGETFDTEAPFRYWSTSEPDAACELARRALLSQGYQVDNSKKQTIQGEKLFQPQPDYVMKLNITIVCLPSNVGTGFYANALQTRYELKGRGNTASVTLGGIGSINLPFSGDKDSLVKVGEETIVDPVFYRRLFALIDTLGGTRPAE